MTREEFLRNLEEAMEAPTNCLEARQKLAEVETWDSMAALIFMAVADEQLGLAITGNQIAGCTTIGDLLDLLGDKLTN